MFGLRVGEAIARHRRNRLVGTAAASCTRFLDAYENLNYDSRSNGESFVLETLKPTKPSCIFDVGANVGHWSLMAHAICPDATIHAFEILKSTYDVLESQTRAVDKIIANASGLSNKDEMVTLKYFPENTDLTTMSDYPRDMKYTEVTGHVATGDAYAEEHGIDRIDFLKIDVEGAENLVLEGFARTIDRDAIDVIQFEYGTINILTKFLLRDFFDFFEGKGYAVGKIYPNYVDFRAYQFDLEDFRGPNFLAVRNERDDLIALFS